MPTDPNALFPVKPPRERVDRSTEKAARAVVNHWQETGHVLDELAVQLLIGSARNVDEAINDHKKRRTNAQTVQRCYDSLAARYMDIRPAINSTAVDPFAEALEELMHSE